MVCYGTVMDYSGAQASFYTRVYAHTRARKQACEPIQPGMGENRRKGAKNYPPEWEKSGGVVCVVCAAAWVSGRGWRSENI
jgi:hypothetical protein